MNFPSRFPTPEETQTYHEIEKEIRRILSVHSDYGENVDFVHNKGNLAVSFFALGSKNRSLWFTAGKHNIKVGIKAAYAMRIDSIAFRYFGLMPDTAGRYSERIASVSELSQFEKIILDIYEFRERDAKGKLFDCCHRYMECSDAKECTNPNEEARMCCSYRSKLKQGIIFYGQNRNVD